ncbi:hypothetical protein KRP22_014301 [Phytophthora ramorum]|nr:hypothetical protein KRP22_9099 [Phytophthora ramorum]
MSLLEATSDDEVTVSEAIAFIDSFQAGFNENDGGSTISVQSPPPDSDNSMVSSSLSSQRNSAAGKENAKRKKNPNPPGYSTRVQQRKRAEIQSLRHEARALEDQLDQLKNGQPVVNTAYTHVTEGETAIYQSKWKAVIELERNARRESEEKNRKLKEMLTHQMEANRDLRCTLKKSSLLKGIEFVFETKPTPSYFFSAFENSKAIIGHLEELVVKMYLASGPLFESWSSSSLGYSMQTKFDKQRGKIAEMKATTPVACPMETCGRKPKSQEKSWILSLKCQSYVKRVNGLQLLQRFEEPNRIVLARTDLMTLTTEGLQFRNKCITIITRSETDPQHASVVRIYEEIFMDPQEGFQARPEDVAYAQNIVLKHLSWKLHECSQRLQETLMGQFQSSE